MGRVSDYRSFEASELGIFIFASFLHITDVNLTVKEIQILTNLSVTTPTYMPDVPIDRGNEVRATDKH